VSEPPRLGVSPFEADDETTHFPPSLRDKPLALRGKSSPALRGKSSRELVAKFRVVQKK